jgi:hypothetical protein
MTQPGSLRQKRGSTMARWPIGEAEVEQLIRQKELEHVTGAAVDGAPLLAQARRTTATAAGLVQTSDRPSSRTG